MMNDAVLEPLAVEEAFLIMTLTLALPTVNVGMIA